MARLTCNDCGEKKNEIVEKEEKWVYADTSSLAVLDDNEVRDQGQNVLVLTLMFLRFAYLSRRFREILLLNKFPIERKS